MKKMESVKQIKLMNLIPFNYKYNKTIYKILIMYI